MKNQLDYAHCLKKLHIKGSPLILFNVWDAGSARAAEEVGCKVIATSSWSVACAQGFKDGEQMPFNLVLENLERIIKTVNHPVTIDLESGYGQSPEKVRETVTKIMAAGTVGINFEDQIIGTDNLYSCDEQCARIKAAVSSRSIPIFLNARTDIFLKVTAENHFHHLDEALYRATAYAESGASGFFTPGLNDETLIKELCELSPIPINIMISSSGPSPKRLAELGVSRISYGPTPYCLAMKCFSDAGAKALAMKEML